MKKSIYPIRMSHEEHANDKTGNFWISIAELIELGLHNPEFQVHILEFIKVFRDMNPRRGN